MDPAAWQADVAPPRAELVVERDRQAVSRNRDPRLDDEVDTATGARTHLQAARDTRPLTKQQRRQSRVGVALQLVELVFSQATAGE